MRWLFLLSAALFSVTPTSEARLQSPDHSLQVTDPAPSSACVVVADDLPEECSCTEPHAYSVVMECVKVFNSTFLDDTIGLKVVLDPCDPVAARLSIDVTEQNYNIDYPIDQITAGVERNYPIPGMNVHVPYVVNLGLDVDVLVEGNLDALTLKLGLNACAGVSTRQMCAGDIPLLNDILPWWVLDGTYSFGDYCEAQDEMIMMATSR